MALMYGLRAVWVFLSPFYVSILYLQLLLFRRYKLNVDYGSLTLDAILFTQGVVQLYIHH